MHLVSLFTLDIKALRETTALTTQPTDPLAPCVQGDQILVSMLLEAGAAVNARDQSGGRGEPTTLCTPIW